MVRRGVRRGEPGLRCARIFGRERQSLEPSESEGTEQTHPEQDRSPIEGAPSSSTDSPGMATVGRWVVEPVAVVTFGADDRLDLAGFTEAELEDGLAGARLRNHCLPKCLRCLTREGEELPEITALSIRLVYSSCTATKEASVLTGSLPSLSIVFRSCIQRSFDREFAFSIRLICRTCTEKKEASILTGSLPSLYG